MWERASTRRSVAASANSVFGVRRCVTIGLFTMLYTIRSGCGPWDRLGRSPHLVAAALSRMLWGEAGRCTPRGGSRRGVDSCHLTAVKTSMPGHGWIARMKSTTRRVAEARAVSSRPEASGLGLRVGLTTWSAAACAACVVQRAGRWRQGRGGGKRWCASVRRPSRAVTKRTVSCLALGRGGTG